MTSIIQVAKDRDFDETKTVLPVEVARGVYIKNPPSAAALKLLHLMINISGGRMADEIQHDMRLSDIHKIEGMRKHDRASITPLFAELAAAVLINDDTEKMMLTIGSLVDDARIDYRHETAVVCVM